MKIYNYDDTGEFAGESSARIDPLETKIFNTGKPESQHQNIYLMPRNSTKLQPPASKKGKKIVWNGEAWKHQDLPDLEKK